MRKDATQHPLGGIPRAKALGSDCRDLIWASGGGCKDLGKVFRLQGFQEAHPRPSTSGDHLPRRHQCLREMWALGASGGFAKADGGGHVHVRAQVS